MAGPGFISDEQMAVLESGGATPGFMSDAQMAALERSAGGRRPYEQEEVLGPDYNQSLLATAGKAVEDSPSGFLHTLKSAYNFAMPFDELAIGNEPSGPIDTVRRSGALNTARTTGSLASATAGAAALAPFGAGWGSVLGPVGTFVGGVGAGAVGGGLGLLGFDLAADAAGGAAAGNGLDEVRPAGEYAKDFVYNTVQGGTQAGALGALGKIPAARRFAAPFTQEGADTRAGTRLNEMIPGGASQVDEAIAANSSNPFFDHTPLGELIDSPVVKNEQRTIARSGSDSYGRSFEAKKLRDDAYLKYLENDIESSPMTVEDVAASVKEGVANKEAASQRGLTAAEGQVDEALSQLPPPIEVTEAGSTIRQGVAEGLDAQRGRVTAGFEGIGEGVVDPSPVKSIVSVEMPKYFREVGAQPNGGLVDLVKSLTREGEPTGLVDNTGQPIIRELPFNIKDIQAMRSQAIEVVKGSDAKSAGVAGKIIKGLDESVDNAIKAGQLTPEQVASWKTGIKERQIQGEVYESKGVPSKSVLGKEYSGNYSVPESAVPSKFWRPGEKGTREAMQNYKRAFGDSEAALEPIHRYATDSFRRAAVKEDGTVDIKKANNWVKLHEEALKETPSLRELLTNVNERQRFLNEKFGDLKRSKAEVENGALQLWLKDVEPKAAITEMLSGKDLIKRTVATADYLKRNDPDALAGLRRGVIEYLKEKTFVPDGKVSLEEAAIKDSGKVFDGTVRDAVFKKEWERIKPALEKSKLYTESQMKGYDILYKSKASQMSVEKSKMPGGSDTAQNLSVLSKMIRAGSRGYLRTLPGGAWLSMVEPILKAIPEEKFMSRFEEALLNPRLARDLMNKASAKNLTKSVQEVFKEEISKAFGDTTPGAAAVTGAKTALPFVPVEQNEKKKIVILKQNQVTATKSFPKPTELLTPVAKGSLKKTSLNMKDYLANQSPETKARVSVESSGNPWATSPKGAQGLSQLMPATAQEIASELGETYMPLRQGMTPEQQQFSIEQNLRFGDYYYGKQLKRFKEPTLARAAYNAGPARVEEAMKMAGSSRNVNAILGQLPKGVQKETIPYVEKIAQRYGNVG
jgi:hypothetical protein